MAKSMTLPSLCRFNLSELDLPERIGRGNFSVYRAIKGGESMAVKEMECDVPNQIPREVEVHSTLPPHPNVLPLLGIAHSNDGFTCTIYICTPLADKSLNQYLHTEKKKPSLEQSTKWALQIAEGMHHIHQHGLAHRDLKSPNVLLFEKDDLLKVCDFGSARVLERTTVQTKRTGTSRWMAPEFSNKGNMKVNQRCDVFSYGMVLYEIFAHELPFPDLDDRQVVRHIHDRVRPSIPPALPLYIQKLMEMCWKHRPNHRPTFETIVKALRTCTPPPPSQISVLEEQFHMAAQSGDANTVKKLIEDGVDVNARTDEDRTALLWAAMNGHTAVVQTLVGEKANTNLCDKDGLSPLYVASQFGHTEIVEILLKSKADPNLATTAPPCSVPLGIASQEGQTEIVDKLLRGGANINYQDKEGGTALKLASQKGNLEVVKLLLKRLADISLCNKNGASPLYSASSHGHTEVVETLLKSGADPNQTTMDGASVLYSASERGLTKVVDALLKNGADPNLATTAPPCSAPLAAAAHSGHLHTVMRLLEGGANMDHQNKSGTSALFSASERGHTEVVDALLKCGADPNLATTDEIGTFPLGVAAGNGRTDAVKRLLEGGADINYQDKYGQTALSLSSWKGYVDVVQVLLESGAMDLPSRFGTALSDAKAEGHADVVRLLEQHSHTQ